MTDLTINKALQKGIAAHKAGQLREAEGFYAAILKSQPAHPDANHNMGILALSVGRTETVLSFLKPLCKPTLASHNFGSAISMH